MTDNVHTHTYTQSVSGDTRLKIPCRREMEEAYKWGGGRGGRAKKHEEEVQGTCMMHLAEVAMSTTSSTDAKNKRREKETHQRYTDRLRDVRGWTGWRGRVRGGTARVTFDPTAVAFECQREKPEVIKKKRRKE